MLERKKNEIRQNAERLAEKYDNAYEHQKTLFKRAIELVRATSAALPHMSSDEKEFVAQVKNIYSLTQTLDKQIEHMRRKFEARQIQTEGWSRNNAIKTLVLPAKQEEVIKQIITEMYVQLHKMF